MSDVYFTSDSHFNHKNICRGTSQWDKGYRDFDSLEEMNDTIIDNLNAVVRPEDTLYHLGDFAFGDKTKIPELRSRINCRNIHFLFGNHDQVIQYKMPMYQKEFSSCHYYAEKRVGKILITMFHYPIGSWNEIGRGSIQLHGHCHDNYKRTIGRQMDVGVDANDFKPVSLDYVMERMRNTPIETVDHHTHDTNYG